MKHDYLEISEINEKEYIVKNELSNKYVKLGANETSFLFETLGIQSSSEFKLDTKLSLNLSEETKKLLMQKFEEWGFLGENSEINHRKIKMENISHIPIISIRPEKFLKRIYPLIKPLFTLPGLIIIIMLALANLILAFWKLNDVYHSITNIENLKVIEIIILIVSIIFTIALHEVGHAATCTKYGGKVSKMGIVLFFFFPCFYCDVSDIYLFKKKKEVALVALSGVYINFMLANLVLVGYFILLIKGIRVNSLVYYYMLNMGIIIYNLMPLVKMDGYWFVSALVGVNNLMDKSILLFIAMLFERKTFKRIKVDQDKKILLGLYGALAFLFYPLFWLICLKGLHNQIMGFIPTYGVVIVLVLAVIIIWDIAKRISYYINLYRKDGNRILSLIS